MRRIALLLIVLLTLMLTATSPDWPAPGTVFQLQGTVHLWIADHHGVLHWAGDTRALAGKYVAWSNRRDVSLAELQTYRIGDPWLSAGLLKDGFAIYQVKWESEWLLPKLLHIQSIKDVELFGIDSTNYGDLVLDKFHWEYRYRLRVAGLQREILPAVVPGPSPTPMPTWGSIPTPWPTATVRPHPTWPPAWRPSPSPTPQWAQPAQQTSGTWARGGQYDRERMQIEVLSHHFDSRQQLVVTVRLHNLQPVPFFPDSSSIALRGDGKEFTTFDQRSRCAYSPSTLHEIANKLGNVISEKFEDTRIPGGETVSGNLCFRIPAGLRSLELVPYRGLWDGPALRIA